MSPVSSIYISSIALSVNQKSGKTVDHIVLQTRTGGFKKEIPGQLSPGQEHKEVFDALLELSGQDELSISMQYQRRPFGIQRMPHIAMAMKQSEIVKEAREDAHRNKTYMKLYRNIFVTIDIPCYSAATETAHVNEPSLPIVGSSHDVLPPATSEMLNERSPPVIGSPHDALPPTASEIVDECRLPVIGSSHDALPSTTNEILRVCPRFRLLIIGNTGVGKSSLIRRVFGVHGVDVSNSSRGKAEIDLEFVASENGLFVLHDSLGLEPAEGDNLAKIKNFIRDRRQKQDPKDRLHAVWVCVEVPYVMGPLLEAGIEEFLRDRKEILGDIPIVVVLTKLDLLDNRLMETMQTEGIVFKSIEEVRPLLEPRRAMYLEEHCTRPLVRVAGSDVSHVAVSTIPGYGLELTILELVKETTSEIERYIRADPSYGVMSEQLRIELNAPLYTAGMAQRASVEAKVDLTIEIWKHRYWANLGVSSSLSHERVKEYLLAMHRDIIQVWNFDDPEMALQDDKFKEALLDTSNFGVGDIAGGRAFLASVASVVFQSTQIITKRFMAHITDLIYVMKILYALAPHGSVTPLDVALALNIYAKSTYRNRVHLEINDFSAATVMLPGGRNAVVEKIQVLIRRYNITDEDVLRLRSQIHGPDAPQNAVAKLQ